MRRLRRRITLEPDRMDGQLCVCGHRLQRAAFLDPVVTGRSLEQIQEDFPFVETDDVRQVISYGRFWQISIPDKWNRLCALLATASYQAGSSETGADLEGLSS
jgi:uncharacterized protein (DUF433 family)